MRRVRIALLAVSVVILTLVGALAWRAHQGLLAERALRHRAVAERAFEEMERELSSWLTREENRPVEHYAFYLPGSAVRTPLSGPLEPFVVGAFRGDVDGRLSAVLEPRDPDAARARGDWPLGESQQLALARVERVVGELWTPGKRDEAFDARRDPQLGRAGEARQAPGTTRALAGPGVDSASLPEAQETLAKKESSSAYEVLQSLNRAGAERSDRKQKQVVARVEGDLEAELDSAGALRGLGYASADELTEREGFRAASSPPVRRPAAAAQRARAVDDLADRAAAPEEAAAQARAPEPAPVAEPERRAVSLTLDPMLGVAVGADSLVLYRTILVGERAFRQGLVLDRAALGGWLEERVIAESALSRVAALRFDTSAAEPPTPGTLYLFAHRFAEPFDALHAELALAALPGESSPAALGALVALLLAVGGLGLLAVHRTASVVLQYAEQRGNFVAAVTHELKTPLTAIRMYAEMLRDGLVPDDAKRREYYGTITEESERLSRLVDNVLEFSRLEGGRRELRLEVGAVGPVLSEAVEKLRTHAAREAFALQLELEPELPPVRFDRDALLQVLYNLIDNAMKYARRADERRIVLEARSHAGGVRIAVRDFGPGVARGHLEHLFEPFYRAETELTRDTKGTGIGLALVKELAERMGAAVSGANAEGGGLRVGLAFPAATGGSD